MYKLLGLGLIASASAIDFACNTDDNDCLDAQSFYNEVEDRAMTDVMYNMNAEAQDAWADFLANPITDVTQLQQLLVTKLVEESSFDLLKNQMDDAFTLHIMTAHTANDVFRLTSLLQLKENLTPTFAYPTDELYARIGATSQHAAMDYGDGTAPDYATMTFDCTRRRLSEGGKGEFNPVNAARHRKLGGNCEAAQNFIQTDLRDYVERMEHNLNTGTGMYIVFESQKETLELAELASIATNINYQNHLFVSEKVSLSNTIQSLKTLNDDADIHAALDAITAACQPELCTNTDLVTYHSTVQEYARSLEVITWQQAGCCTDPDCYRDHCPV